MDSFMCPGSHSYSKVREDLVNELTSTCPQVYSIRDYDCDRTLVCTNLCMPYILKLSWHMFHGASPLQARQNLHKTIGYSWVQNAICAHSEHMYLLVMNIMFSDVTQGQVEVRAFARPSLFCKDGLSHETNPWVLNLFFHYSPILKIYHSSCTPNLK